MDAPEDLIVARPQPGVLLLTLNRPAVRNALRSQTLREMATILGDAASDDDVRAVVLTGGLAFFAAGADVREMATLGIVDILLHERQRHWRALATFPKPLIGAVCGYALGGGCELALCCDILLAGNNAQFGRRARNRAGARDRDRDADRVQAAARRASCEGSRVAGLRGRAHRCACGRAPGVRGARGNGGRREGIAAFLEKRPPKFQGR